MHRYSASIVFAACCLPGLPSQEGAGGEGPVDPPGAADPAAPGEIAAQLRSLRMFAGGGGTGPGGQPDLSGMTSLLQTNAALQDELGLTERQAGRLKEVSAEARRRQESLFRRIREAGGGLESGQEPGEVAQISQAKEGFDPAQLHKGLITIGQESDRTIGQILTPKQWRRLYQIALRIEGTTAVARPDVADAIGLFPAQRAEVAAIVNQMKSSQQGLTIARMEGGIAPPDRKSRDPSRPTAPAGKPGTARSGRGIPADPGPKAREEGDERDRLLKAAERRIAGILNSSQKKSFNRLLGPDFDLTALVRPPEKAGPAPNDDPSSSSGAPSKEGGPRPSREDPEAGGAARPD